MEAGERKLDSLELARIARVLHRPIDWFVTPSLPAVVSRRKSREAIDESQADVLLESLARDVKLLIELKLLEPRRVARPRALEDVASAEAAARELRRTLGVESGRVWDLLSLAERAGLYAFSLDLRDESLDGSYVRLENAGGRPRERGCHSETFDTFDEAVFAQQKHELEVKEIERGLHSSILPNKWATSATTGLSGGFERGHARRMSLLALAAAIMCEVSSRSPDQELRHRVYSASARGARAPGASSLAATLGVGVDAVREGLERLHAAHALVLDAVNAKGRSNDWQVRSQRMHRRRIARGRHLPRRRSASRLARPSWWSSPASQRCCEEWVGRSEERLHNSPA